MSIGHVGFLPGRSDTMTPDLRTSYLGLRLSNPLVVSASPLSGSLDTLRRLEEAGAAAVVMHSLFEEQVEHEELHVHHVMEMGAHAQPEACAYFPELDAAHDRLRH